jgi:hypothetical protein
MRLCYLHIGPHKTGSSSIQTLLFSVAEELNRQGFYIPDMVAIKAGGRHHLIAQELRSGRGTGYLAGLAAELRRHDCPSPIVLSSEGLSLRIHEREARDRIADYFSDLGYAVTVLAHVRPQASRMNSLYTERIKKLIHDDTFDDFLTRFRADPLNDLGTKFAGLLTDARFRTVLIPFNKALLRHGIGRDFLGRIGADTGFLGDTVEMARNESPGAKTVAALLEIGRRRRASGLAVSQESLVACASALRKMAGTLGWNADKYLGSTIAQRCATVAQFGAGNHAFAERVWQCSWSELFGEDDAALCAEPQCVYSPVAASASERAEFEEFCTFGLDLLSRQRAPAA